VAVVHFQFAAPQGLLQGFFQRQLAAHQQASQGATQHGQHAGQQHIAKAQAGQTGL